LLGILRKEGKGMDRIIRTESNEESIKNEAVWSNTFCEEVIVMMPENNQPQHLRLRGDRYQ
jgi:hypothetical protein